MPLKEYRQPPARAGAGISAAVASYSLETSRGEALESLAWRSFGKAVGGDLSRVQSVVMASSDVLDARGISCMLMSGMLAAVCDEQTRVEDGAWALFLAAAQLDECECVAVLGWEKPDDYAVGRLAMTGDPLYQRPVGWTPGLQRMMDESRLTGTAALIDTSRISADRAACIVLSRSPGPVRIHLTLVPGEVASPGGNRPPLDLPATSPVHPLAELIGLISRLKSQGAGPAELRIPVLEGSHFLVRAVRT